MMKFKCNQRRQYVIFWQTIWFGSVKSIHLRISDKNMLVATGGARIWALSCMQPLQKFLPAAAGNFGNICHHSSGTVNGAYKPSEWEKVDVMKFLSPGGQAPTMCWGGFPEWLRGLVNHISLEATMCLMCAYWLHRTPWYVLHRIRIFLTHILIFYHIGFKWSPWGVSNLVQVRHRRENQNLLL